MDLKLDGRHARVTGSSSGIGEAIAKMLAAESAVVAVHGRKLDGISRVGEEIRSSGGTDWPTRAT
jgi:NADP-dependent 3-hydroxy acid dehydrogenase YdfG